tara:strand:+ start:381 stop:989 length:609 start_codon:yes stop_codon:yes gene_type:complete
MLKKQNLCEKKHFYVCSCGGSGSYMLTYALKKYGNVYHVHTRTPPIELKYAKHDMFTDEKVPPECIKNHYVIYLYRNPARVLCTGVFNGEYRERHLNNIQSPDTQSTVDDIILYKEDLYGLCDFYKNYTSVNKSFNYKIICVKFEDLFKKKDELSAFLNVGPLNLKMKSNMYVDSRYKELADIYESLINEMEKNESIFLAGC